MLIIRDKNLLHNDLTFQRHRKSKKTSAFCKKKLIKKTFL